MNGSVGIGINYPREKLTVAGHISGTGSVYTSAGDINAVIALVRANSAAAGWSE